MDMNTAEVATAIEEPKTYDDKIIACYKDLCSKQTDGASPSEVTSEMAARGWLTSLDTVIDVEKIMRRLRYDEGRL